MGISLQKTVPMRKLIQSILAIAILLSLAFAQQPEPIYSFARVLHPAEWYEQQVKAWKKEIDKNPKNAYAWYNYYRANRNLLNAHQTVQLSQAERWKKLQGIVNDMEKKVPDSYEFNLVKWMNGGNNLELLPYLEKARQLGPDRHELFSDMVGTGEIKGNTAQRDEYARKWYSSGEVSPGLLYYNYNVLAGLKQNAILITTGDNDTYPIWILQAAKGFRTDVTVLNTSLLYISEYRRMIFQKLGVKDPAYEIFKDTLTPWPQAQKKHDKAIFDALVGNSGNHPVYIALTVDKDNYEFAADKLYLEGLAYEYSKTPVDNMAELKRNFEQLYTLDYLDKYFFPDMSEGIVKLLNCNYVVPMVRLYDHYRASGEQQKADRLKAVALRMVAGSAQEKEVNDYFKQN